MKPSINKAIFVEAKIYNEEDVGATDDDDDSADYYAMAEQNDEQDTLCLLNPTTENYYDDENLDSNDCADNEDLKHINWVEDNQVADY